MPSKYPIFSIESEKDFNKKALELFEFQSQHCKVYKEFLSLIKFKKPNSFKEIPCLPISFFKSHKVISGNSDYSLLFQSSGTSNQKKSKHYIKDSELYKQSFLSAYKQFIGDPKEHVILALLPNYLEQGNSSLVYMVKELINETKNSSSKFILENKNSIIDVYSSIKNDKKLVLIGVSYALLDLAKDKINLENTIVIETGGMKGRRKEITKEELHYKLRKGLNTKDIFSEYGMTELLSQAYSTSNQIFKCPNWLKINIRDVNDPFKLEKDGKIGAINIIDLANYHSCAFIATDDLGRALKNGFQITGRTDQSEQRGCNLLIQENF